LDESGNVVNRISYDAFGAVTNETNPSVDFRFGYTGQELDPETGLYNYGRRFYNPGTGRFLNEDPTGFDAGDSNLYRYVGNNPINLVDPNGLCAVVANNGFVHPAEVEYSIASDSNVHLTPFNSDNNSSPELSFDFPGDKSFDVAQDSDTGTEICGPICKAIFLPLAVTGVWLWEQFRRVGTDDEDDESNYDESTRTDSREFDPNNINIGTYESQNDIFENLETFPGNNNDFLDGDTFTFPDNNQTNIKEYLETFPAGLDEGLESPFFDSSLSENWRSRPSYGHTFDRHGQGGKNTQKLQGRASGTGQAQGQWINNERTVEFLRNLELNTPDTKNGNIVDIPEGLGQIIHPDGTITPAERAFVLQRSDKTFKTAYPVE
jgi:RHS repeat-associated protein